jgi:hypothetical protein
MSTIRATTTQANAIINTPNLSGDLILEADSNLVDCNITGAIKLPIGTLSERPTKLSGATLRINTTTKALEYFNGSSWTVIWSDNTAPVWTTASGTVATINDSYGTYTNVATLQATDPDPDQTIFYTIVSGNLPSGMTLNPVSGVISGKPANVDAQTTYIFDVSATDSMGGTSTRTFNIVVNKVNDGTNAARAATNPAAILSVNSSSTDGWYYYIASDNTVYGAYTKFNWLLNRHWVLVLKVTDRADMPSGSGNWTNNSVVNASDTNITSGSWAKYASWNSYSFNYILLDMNGVVPAIMQFNTARTMYSAMQNNGTGAFGGLGCDSTTPAISTNLRYQDGGFYAVGGPFGSQTGAEPYIQLYGINSFANNASNSTSDNASLLSVGRAGARVGCALDDGGHTFNAASNGGSDSGFGFGFCAGNAARTGSCGYAEWNSTAVVNTLPGRLWVS